MLSSRVKTWLVRAAPGPLASWSRSVSKRQFVTALLSSNTTEFHETEPPRAAAPNFKLLLAGSALGVLLSSHAECAPKKKAKTTNSKPAAAKKPGPALGLLEAALRPDKTFNVEKLLATRLKSGKKEYLVSWEGYDSKHDSWEYVENLANLVEEMAAFDRAKEDENQKHLQELAKQKAEREAARAAAGTANAGPSDVLDEEEEPQQKDVGDAWKKKSSRCYEAFQNSDKPGYGTCIATEGVAGGCMCGEEIKLYTQSLWTHLKSKHPRLWQELKGLLGAGAPIDGGVAASIGAMSTQTTLAAPKLTEARKKQGDRACARWLIKSSRPITLPATSAGCERVFSAAGRAHHDLKAAMQDNSLEHQLLAAANTD